MRLREFASIISEAPVSAAMRGTRYYHGTKTTAAAESIRANGIQPDQLRAGQVKKGTRGHLDPVLGRAYLTPSLHYGVIYAIGGVMMGHTMRDDWIKGERYGYLFVVDGNDLSGDIQPDEDSVGEFMADHTERGWDQSSKPWRRLPSTFKSDGTEDAAKKRVWQNIRSCMTPQQIKNAEEGLVAAQAAGGKRALKKLPVQDMLDLIRWGAHVAHQGGIKPIECWRIDKTRTVEIAKDGSNFFEIAEKID